LPANTVIDANAEGAFGLYPAADFRVVTGDCEDCATLRQALWYFRNESIAVPLPGLSIASFTRGLSTFDDVRAWLATRAKDARIDYPPLVWVAAPQIVRGARLAGDGDHIDASGTALGLHPVPRIPLNRSYYDASSVRFLTDRALTLRGTRNGD